MQPYWINTLRLHRASLLATIMQFFILTAHFLIPLQLGPRNWWRLDSNVLDKSGTTELLPVFQYDIMAGEKNNGIRGCHHIGAVYGKGIPLSASSVQRRFGLDHIVTTIIMLFVVKDFRCVLSWYKINMSLITVHYLPCPGLSWTEHTSITIHLPFTFEEFLGVFLEFRINFDK